MRMLKAIFVLSVAACGGSTGPSNSLDGVWNAFSMNGQALPATYDNGALHFHVFSRQLTLSGTGGSWNDSTVLSTNGLPDFNASAHQFIKWSRSGDELSVVGATTSSQLNLHFIVEPDGTLQSDFLDNMIVVYRRQ